MKASNIINVGCMALMLGFASTGANAASDDSFVKKASQGGLAEVKMGELAQERAQNSEVKEFAQHLVSEHQQANTELQQLAQTKGMKLETEVGGKYKQTISKLEKANGQEFDKKFMEAVVKEHKDDVKEFKKQAEKGKDPDIKNWAQKTLPSLEKHLQMAQQLQQKVAKSGQGASGSGGSSADASDKSEKSNPEKSDEKSDK